MSSRSAHVSSTFPVAAKRGKRRAAPDLDLIKQMEQVATLGLGGAARRFARFGARESRSGRDHRISNLSVISVADISLQKTAKTARSGRGRPVCERVVRHPAGLPPPVPPPTRSSAKFGGTDLENLACCPDFKLSHDLLGDFVVAPMPDALPSLIVSARRGTERRRDGVFE